MSGTIVRVDQLGDAIRKEIESMNKEVIEKTNKAADDMSKEGVRLLRATSPVRADGYTRKYPPGSYAKSWMRKKEGNALGVTKWTIYNKDHYQLNHLLEFGHIVKDHGGRELGNAKPFPHIAKVNAEVSSRYVKIVEDMPL